MRKIFFICFIIIVYHVTTSAQNHWEWIAPYPHGNGAAAVSIVDNYIYFWGDNETIAKTSNGGSSFEICTPYADMDDVYSSSPQRIAFADSLTGIVVATSNKMYRTTNGGKSWTLLNHPGSSYITFANSHIGWKGPYLEKTTDAGITWNSMYDPVLEESGNYEKIFALDSMNVWVIKSDDYYDEGSGIYFSSDGGVNWQKQNSPTFTNKLFFRDIVVSHNGYGFATAQQYNSQSHTYIATLFKTSDFGASWEYNTYDEYWLTNCFFKSDSEWLIFGNTVSVQPRAVKFYSTNFGENWEITNDFYFGQWESYISTGAYLQDINTLIVVGHYGFFRSMDFGKTFQKLTNNTDLLITDFSIDNIFDDNQQLVAAISEEDKYIISVDGGNTWTQDSIPVINSLREICIKNGIIYLLSGYSRRYVYKSSDFGNTWEEIANFYSYLTNLEVLDDDNFMIINQSSPKSILYTEDGGTSFTEGPIPGNYIFNSVQLAQKNTIYGCGLFSISDESRGFVYITTNKGLDWRIIDFDDQLENIQMVDEQIGYVQGRRKVFKTTNSGADWELIYEVPQYSYFLNSLYFYDINHGIIHDNYKILVTYDGGQTWSRNYMNLPVWGGVEKFEVNKDDQLFALTDGARFLKFVSQFNSGNHQNNNNNIETDFTMFDLKNNYPNPFNPTTKIRYEIPLSSFVTIKVYDVLGNEVATLVNEEKPSGSYEVEFNGSSLTSGIYFYQLQAGAFIQTKKMILLK